MTTEELEQIRKIIREETVSKEDLKATEERLTQKIVEAQEETIDTLSEVIHTGFNMHEERIEALEKHAGIPTPNKN